MNKMRQIAKEFDEPFVDVVKGFAEMGYSIRATARTLDINHEYLGRLINRFNIRSYFKPRKEMVKECRGGQSGGWPKGKKRK